MVSDAIGGDDRQADRVGYLRYQGKGADLAGDIEQKTSGNANAVTFELSNPIDFEGLKIPVRQISNYFATGARWVITGVKNVNLQVRQCLLKIKHKQE